MDYPAYRFELKPETVQFPTFNETVGEKNCLPNPASSGHNIGLTEDEEFWHRQKALEIAADHETKLTPVIDTLDLLALRKPRK